MSKLRDTLRNLFWSTPTRKGWTLVVIILLIASVLMRFIAPVPPPHVALSGEPIFSNGPQWLTNSILMTIIVDIVLIILALATRFSLKEIPGGLQNVMEAVVETLGVAVRASKVSRIPVSMFLVPKRDVFHSIVTRDSVPDAEWRSFSFHFRPGLSPEQRVERATQVLGLGRQDLEELAPKRTVLPSPALGHEAIVAEIDRLSAGRKLCVLGNWFAGLSIEDCVDRSLSEWKRVEALG